MNSALMTTSVAGFPRRSGKVRDLYDLGDRLLIVATDRISAYDVVMPNGIPDKGRVLTQIALFWFRRLAGLAPNHVLSANVADLPKPFRRQEFDGRVMLCRSCQVVPVECVVRGYLAGSGWKEYGRSGTVCGLRLPAGLRQCDRLPQPVFTPATKAATGHDENISFEQATEAVGLDLAGQLRDLSVALYSAAAEYAAGRGVIIADTKFEWGHDRDGRLMLIDEALTPDSSRFWPADGYQPGRDQPSFDKQFLRNWLDEMKFNRQPPAPTLPDDVVACTRQKYVDAYTRLTGQPFPWT